MNFNSEQIKLALVGILAVALALGVGRFAYTPILPFMREELSLSSSQAGLISSWNYFGYLLGSLSILFPFFGRRLKTSFISACLMSIGSTAMTGATENFDIICTARFINGFSGALVLICGTSLIFSKLEDFPSPDFRLAHFSGFGLGMAISSIIVIICASFNVGWKGQWMFMALICLILFFPVLILTPSQSKIFIEKTTVELRGNTGFLLLCLGYFCFGFSYIIYGTFISDFVRLSESFSGLENIAWLVAGISAIPSAIFWQKIGNLTSLDLALLLSSLISALGALILLFTTSHLLVLMSCILYGFGIPGVVSLTLLEGKKRFQGSTTTSIALLTTSFSFGQILGPYVSGSLIDRYDDYILAITISAIFLAVGGLLMIDLSRKQINR